MVPPRERAAGMLVSVGCPYPLGTYWQPRRSTGATPAASASTFTF